jgi:hypothetical protein
VFGDGHSHGGLAFANVAERRKPSGVAKTEVTLTNAALTGGLAPFRYKSIRSFRSLTARTGRNEKRSTQFPARKAPADAARHVPAVLNHFPSNRLLDRRLLGPLADLSTGLGFVMIHC